MGFSIHADNLSWIKGRKDDPEDLCLHGHAVAVIGDRTLEYDATVSATALFLLRTLTEDRIPITDDQMLPCCGHFMLADEACENVTILGCPNGIDWFVEHNPDGTVTIILTDGTEETVPFADYRAEVLRFADAIEHFYDSCSPKVPDEEQYIKAYRAFWNEWHRRRNAADSQA